MSDDKKPAIRFKNYSDDWEQRKVGDYYEFKNGLNKSKEFFGEGTPIVNFTDVFHNRGIFPEMLSGKVRLELSEIKNYEVKKGDIFFTRTSETIEEIGYPSVMLGEPENTVFSGFVLRGRCFLKDDPLDNLFKKYLFFTDVFRTEMLRKSSMTTRALTSGTAIKNMEFLHPLSKEEQHRIGELLTKLDHLITLHQRKYDKLQNLKKAMLEKMFPKNGSNVPKIRFKGFTDAWEQRKLGDVVQITMGQSPDGSTYSDEPSDYILVQGNADLQNGWVCPRIWTTQITKKADAGDLIMSVRAPAGAMGKTAYNAVIGRGVAAIKGNEFIYQLLVKMDMDGFWKTLSCGSTFESLNSNNIKNAEVKVPITAEQVQIGNFFQQLDNLITLHQRELEKLKNIKKAMLEKMFV